MCRPVASSPAQRLHVKDFYGVCNTHVPIDGPICLDHLTVQRVKGYFCARIVCDVGQEQDVLNRLREGEQVRGDTTLHFSKRDAGPAWVQKIELRCGSEAPRSKRTQARAAAGMSAFIPSLAKPQFATLGEGEGAFHVSLPVSLG